MGRPHLTRVPSLLPSRLTRETSNHTHPVFSLELAAEPTLTTVSLPLATGLHLTASNTSTLRTPGAHHGETRATSSWPSKTQTQLEPAVSLADLHPSQPLTELTERDEVITH